MDSEHILHSQIHDLEHRFDSSLAAIAFSATGLSIQFSPHMGNELPWVLICSWAVLLLSGLLGGWRLMYKPVALKHNLRRNELIMANRPTLARHHDDKINAFNTKFMWAHKLQVWLLIGGLLANGVFSAENYLAKVKKNSPTSPKHLLE